LPDYTKSKQKKLKKAGKFYGINYGLLRHAESLTQLADLYLHYCSDTQSSFFGKKCFSPSNNSSTDSLKYLSHVSK
jgi:hypothetical protein